MAPSVDEQTLVPKRRTTSVVDRTTTGLPTDLLSRAADRLQTLAWLYAFTFFMAAFFQPLLVPEARASTFERAVNWVPGVIAIAMAVSVGVAIRAVRLRPAVAQASGINSSTCIGLNPSDRTTMSGCFSNLM